MCEAKNEGEYKSGAKTIPLAEAIGMVLAHDITEIKRGEFKGRAFKKGHIVQEDDVEKLRQLGKENLYVLSIKDDEIHEDDAAAALADALAGEGVVFEGESKEGKINLLSGRDGLLKINREALLQFNMLGEVMCATLHTNTIVSKGQLIGGTRAIPLIVKRDIVEEAIRLAKATRNSSCTGVIEVKEIRRPRTGVVITGNEIYYGRIKDAFAPVIRKKIEGFRGEIAGIYYAPDDASFIEARLRELIKAGADLLITTGGMSVDPDDVTRFAIKNLGVTEFHYGSSVLPGAMFLVAYFKKTPEVLILNSAIHNPQSEVIPILGIPACGMYNKITVLDLTLSRILAGEHIGRKELAEMGHGGFCMNCKECRYPVCPFGK